MEPQEDTARQTCEDGPQSAREFSPDGTALDSSTAQLLEEELDNIDCPMAGRGRGGEQGGKPQRPGNLKLQDTVALVKEEDWQILDITFGVPLFDMELNAAVTNR